MAAATNGLPEDPALLRARLAEVEARYAQSQVQFRELRTWYDKLKRHHRELLWSEAVLAREGLEEAMPGPPIADADRANGHIGGGFVLRHHLGAGAFATVYAAVDKEGRPCAVKRIDKYHIKSLESLRNVAGELRALRAAVGCPNLVWVRGVVASETYLSFVMELFGTSNLQEAGAARPQDVRRAAPRIVRGVANGLAHLHARDLHHPVWKSTFVSLHAIEQTQLRRQHRVDGVGRPKFDFRAGRHLPASFRSRPHSRSGRRGPTRWPCPARPCTASSPRRPPAPCDGGARTGACA